MTIFLEAEFMTEITTWLITQSQLGCSRKSVCGKHVVDVVKVQPVDRWKPFVVFCSSEAAQVQKTYV